jgi:hypothetical protein
LERKDDTAGQAAGDLRAIGTTHPVIGPVNGYEMLLMMAIPTPSRASNRRDQERSG